MKRIAITFGSISGAIIIVYTFAIFMVFGDFSHITMRQFEMIEMLGYLRYIVLLLTVFFSMRTFSKQTEKPIKYWSIVKQGVMVILVVAICIGLMEIVYMWKNPGFYEKFSHLYAERLKAGGAGEQELNNARQEMENYKWIQTPVMTGVFYFFETFVIGAVASLIMGRFFITKQ